VLLFELGRYGVREILLLAGSEADRILEYAAATPLKARFGLEIEVLVEPERSDIGGAVWNARDSLDETFLLLTVIRGYTSTYSSWLLGFSANHLQLWGALRPLADASRFGVVEMHGSL
jgi:D-glycero-D-manno-heptose 1,7-bisphosphate phosphatase